VAGRGAVEGDSAHLDLLGAGNAVEHSVIDRAFALVVVLPVGRGP
jgi:hypothetical protein